MQIFLLLEVIKYDNFNNYLVFLKMNIKSILK